MGNMEPWDASKQVERDPFGFAAGWQPGFGGPIRPRVDAAGL